MQIVIQDVNDKTIYTKYQLPNFNFEAAEKKGDTVTLLVSKGEGFDNLQEQFNRASQR